MRRPSNSAAGSVPPAGISCPPQKPPRYQEPRARDRLHGHRRRRGQRPRIGDRAGEVKASTGMPTPTISPSTSASRTCTGAPATFRAACSRPPCRVTRTRGRCPRGHRMPVRRAGVDQQRGNHGNHHRSSGSDRHQPASLPTERGGSTRSAGTAPGDPLDRPLRAVAQRLGEQPLHVRVQRGGFLECRVQAFVQCGRWPGLRSPTSPNRPKNP